jgi:hypothetical protein
VEKMDKEITWPADNMTVAANSTTETRFLSRVGRGRPSLHLVSSQMTVDAYMGCLFSNCLVTILFGIFKCTSFAEVTLILTQLPQPLPRSSTKPARLTASWS